MPTMSNVRQIVIQAGQSLVDIALQEYGTVEGIILLLTVNPGLTVTGDLVPGSLLNIVDDSVKKMVANATAVEPYASQLQSVLMQWITLASGFVGYKIWVGTQAQRDAIAVKDTKTIYLVEE